MKNLHHIDRFFRLVFGVILLQLGYFWLASPWSWLAYGVSVFMFATAIFRFCPIYGLLGAKFATDVKSPRALNLGFAMVLLLALIGGGSYASAFFTRKFFLEDFNAMNYYYKQTLFLTGKEQRTEAIVNFDKLQPALATFISKYSAYRPYNLKGDAELTADFVAVEKILSAADPLIRSGDLLQAHLALEKVRPIFQGMFKRNGFSMLSVALVDFHDAMELILAAATEKDVAEITLLYPDISDKLKVIEAEANDDEIKSIRTALDDVLATASASQLDILPSKGETLKSSFVKVYLKRG